MHPEHLILVTLDCNQTIRRIKNTHKLPSLNLETALTQPWNCSHSISKFSTQLSESRMTLVSLFQAEKAFLGCFNPGNAYSSVILGHIIRASISLLTAIITDSMWCEVVGSVGSTGTECGTVQAVLLFSKLNKMFFFFCILWSRRWLFR